MNQFPFGVALRTANRTPVRDDNIGRRHADQSFFPFVAAFAAKQRRLLDAGFPGHGIMIYRAIAITAMLLLVAYVAMFLQGCAKHTPVVTPANSPSGTVANVGVTPYDSVSPFVCTISASNLTCMASMDVRFRRGQLETQIARGHQFSFHTPTGTGMGTVWFGCAGANTCGPGYFMYGSPNTAVTPVEPARYWQGGSSALVPYGSLGIIEVDINNGQFAQIRNRWAGSIAPPLLKEASGIVVACGDQACTIGLK